MTCSSFALTFFLPLCSALIGAMVLKPRLDRFQARDGKLVDGAALFFPLPISLDCCAEGIEKHSLELGVLGCAMGALAKR